MSKKKEEKQKTDDTTDPSNDKYWYRAQDIITLLVEKKNSTSKKYKIIDPIFVYNNKNGERKSNTQIKLNDAYRIFKSNKDIKSVAIPINLYNKHWVSLVIKNDDDKLTAFYADSLGVSINNELKKELKKDGAIFQFNDTTKGSLFFSPPQKQKNGYDCGAYVVVNLDSLARTGKLPDKIDVKFQRKLLQNLYNNNKIDKDGLITEKDLKNTEVPYLQNLAKKGLLYFENADYSRGQYTCRPLEKSDCLKKIEVQYKKLSKLQQAFINAEFEKLSEDSNKNRPFGGLVIKSMPKIMNGGVVDFYKPSDRKTYISPVDKVLRSGKTLPLSENKFHSTLVHESTHAIDDIFNDFSSSKNVTKYLEKSSLSQEKFIQQVKAFKKLFRRDELSEQYLNKFLKGKESIITNMNEFSKKAPQKQNQLEQMIKSLKKDLKLNEESGIPISIDDMLEGKEPSDKEKKEFQDNIDNIKQNIKNKEQKKQLYKKISELEPIEVAKLEDAIIRQNQLIEILKDSDIPSVNYVDTRLTPEFASFHSERIFKIMGDSSNLKEFKTNYQNALEDFGKDIESHSRETVNGSLKLLEVANKDFCTTLQKSCTNSKNTELKEFSKVVDSVAESLHETIIVLDKKLDNTKNKSSNLKEIIGQLSNEDKITIEKVKNVNQENKDNIIKPTIPKKVNLDKNSPNNKKNSGDRGI